MIGRNKLTMNYHAMLKAVEHYLKNELFSHAQPSHVVTSVREKTVDGLSVFVVEFEPVEKPSPAKQ